MDIIFVYSKNDECIIAALEVFGDIPIILDNNYKFLRVNDSTLSAMYKTSKLLIKEKNANRNNR